MGTINKNVCCFNKMIDCKEHDKCLCCGWNPEVAEKRIDAWDKKRKVEKALEGN